MYDEFVLPKQRFWKDEKKDEMRIFDLLFHGSSPKSSNHTHQKDLEKHD